MSENTTEFKTCAYCGQTNGSVAQHSGVDECHECWTWRKLDGPAAKHWYKAASMFLSNIDMYDAQTFLPKRTEVELDEMRVAIKVAEKIKDACKEMLTEHGFEESTLNGVLRDTYRGMVGVSYYGRDESGDADIALDMSLAHMRQTIGRAEAALKDEHEGDLRGALSELSSDATSAYNFVCNW